MEHGKIFNRDDGSRVKVIVSHTGHNGMEWALVDVEYCDSGSDCFKKSSQLSDERIQTCANYITKDEVKDTMMELWEIMKPKLEWMEE